MPRYATGETKTRKLTLLMRPSVVEKAYKIVHMKHDSLNNVLEVLLENYVETNKSYIEKFDECIETNK